jgi:dTDP-4-amino-4,6-dideoxygalactose transaminase
MNIPLVDLKAQYLSLKEQIDYAINETIKASAFIGGHFVQEFEKNFADVIGIKHCIGVGNGTDAIIIVLKMLGIGPGDEVITTATSWISSSEAISQTGAKPVFVDIESSYYTMDPNKIVEKITKRTKAIMPVHLYGQMADMISLKDICQEFGLYLIEDCAQAHLSQLNNRVAGTFGTASIFSFYPGKNLGAYGDAGCIITEDDELTARCRMFANHGQKKKHDHQIEGINSRLDGLQAAILNIKLPHLKSWNARRSEIASLYNELLLNVPHITTPKVRQDSVHTYHLYVIRNSRRDALKAFLEKRGIQTAIHYPVALPYLSIYRNIVQGEDFPVAHQHQAECLSLPIYPEMTEGMVQYVVEQISRFITRS